MTKSYIMIVDDNPANLRLLEDMLLQEGHEARSFPRGRLALAAAAKNPPDLILLDINMPEMNGYEVCERFNASKELSHIPIIFMSALNDVEDKVKGFRAGAVDYISKPFKFEEVHARVETHLKLHRLQEVLKQQNDSLEEVVAARTRDLATANERLTILDRSKNEFLMLISHELRTPLNGLLGVSELMFDGMPRTPENVELQDIFEQSRGRILSLLDDALLLTQIDVNQGQFASAPVSLFDAMTLAVKRAAVLAESYNITLDTAPIGDEMLYGNQALLVKALEALLETVIKLADSGESVRLSREATGGSMAFVIEARGQTIPASLLPTFFDLFSIGEANIHGKVLGLGPPVASRILSLFGASVSVANIEDPGVRLTVSFNQTLSTS